ncbi:hypothetical protein DESUT3_38820 [Desulfuromonas versatilis]|uniref:Uncharacterized protein n=1 Tax=Desulfuromonas versatilis TaxID=2802975 RepID=A0ABN6E3A4_9BACT|nr:TnpV protein [Desulfuromonas versatilis]BCR06813.1 hypothetical protein DESUT3_38820 [Desulfuromonas versatilis]
MENLNHFGMMRLTYLQTRKPRLLLSMKRSGVLEKHLLNAQKSAAWEWEQLIFAGMEQEAADQFVLNEYILA